MQLKKVCPYAVGDYYITGNSANLSTVWAGTTWQAIRGCVLLAEDNEHAAGSTGGAYTHTHTTGDCTLTATQSGVPAHTHGLNGHVHSVGAHSHGLNGHTHSYNAPANHQHGLGSGYGQFMAFNNAVGWRNKSVSQWSINYHAVLSAQGSHSGTNTTMGMCLAGKTDSGGGSSSATTGGNSGSTANSTAFNTGGNSGNTANNTAANASAAHNHGNTGGGSSLPPYLAVYVWQRTA